MKCKLKIIKDSKTIGYLKGIIFSSSPYYYGVTAMNSHYKGIHFSIEKNTKQVNILGEEQLQLYKIGNLPILKFEAITYLHSKYQTSDIVDLIDAEITSGNWVDDWEEDDDVDDEFDWYEQYGRGEAEDAVRNQIDEEVLEHLKVTKEQYEEQTGEHIFQTTVEVFEELDG